MSYTIFIPTYSKRYEDFFEPLIFALEDLVPDVEKIIGINGPVSGEFNSEYRSEVLLFLSASPNVYPRFYPRFTSISKMMNEAAVTASNDQILYLQDDMMVDAQFFDVLHSIQENNTDNVGNLRSFTINNSFSHMFLNKWNLFDVGFFDERLLGVCNEDADFYVRWIKKFGTPLKNVNMPGIRNLYDQTFNDKYKEDGHETRVGGAPDHAASKEKYSNANHEIFHMMYPNWPEVPGTLQEMLMSSFEDIMKELPDQQQYPYEKFIQKHRALLETPVTEEV